jgi:hypothetical protein
MNNNSWVMILSPVRNISLPSLEALNAMASFVYTTDLLGLAMQIPAALLGLVLNSVSLIVLSNLSKFSMPMYFYIRVSLVDSIVSNAIETGFSLMVSRPYISFSNTEPAMQILAYVIIPLSNNLLYFKYLLDTIIIMDRIATFRPQLKTFWFMKISPLKSSCLAFLISLILVVPQDLLYAQNSLKYMSVDPLTNQTAISTLYFVDTTSFAKSHRSAKSQSTQ